MNNRHFFFKFKRGNSGLIEFQKSKNFDLNKVPLPIYFGPWTIDQYLYKKTNIDFGNSRQKGHREKQVETFFNLKDTNDNIYFWIFTQDEIFAIKLNQPFKLFENIDNQPDYLIDSDNDGSIPKFFFGSIAKEFSKNSLPESFANINSNQKYNRKTIVEFVGIEREIAENLIKEGEKLSVQKNRVFEYLSPIQFETLIFLIFVGKGIFCSTYRGGTKEKYDLTIENKTAIFPEFKKDITLNIQIKMKTEFEPDKSDESTIYIYLGETKKEKNLFGKVWIQSNINENEYINQWLRQSLKYFSIEEKDKRI